MLQTFIASATREWDFLRRSRWDLALATWLPLLCLAILAWLLSSAVPRELPVAVVDEDHSALSRELLRRLDATAALEVTTQPLSLEEAWHQARSLNVYAVVYIPRDVSREVARAGRGTVFAYYNAHYPTAGPAASRDIATVLQLFGGQVALTEVGKALGPGRVRTAPVLVQSTFLFNSTRSYELYLLGLLMPAILHFALCLSVTGAFGRELRDGTAGSWLGTRGKALLPAAAGKMCPYVLLFTLHGCVSLVWLTVVRGNDAHGSASVMVIGQALMYLAYASIAMLLVGATKNMGTALSLTSLYAGTSLGFAGVTFPIDGASLFVRVWSVLLPFTAYLKLQGQQFYMGAPLTASVGHLSVLLLFILISGVLGLRLYGRAAGDPAVWGQR